MAHVAPNCVSPQVYGAAGLQSLVESPPPRGAHMATAGTVVVGVGFCLLELDPILVHEDIIPLTVVIVTPITECYLVHPGAGGSELP